MSARDRHHETAANATMIAQVAGWTGVAEWTKYAAQQSAEQAGLGGRLGR